MVMRWGVFTETLPQSAGVAVIPVWGVMGLVGPVWLPGTPEALIDSAIEDMRRDMTGVEGGGGRSSLLHMFVVQHLEVQFTIVCPWLVKVVFFKLHI